MTSAADWAERALGYRFQDAALLDRALTHRSAGGAHNERLEFLGDAVLALVAAELLHAQWPQADEGELSRRRARLVRRDTLELLGRQLAIGEHLRLGSGELRTGGHERGSILGNALEAVFGAVYLDGGWSAAAPVIGALLRRPEVLATASGELRDPKTRLQELLQARGLDLPVYELKAVAGVAHARHFEVSCRLGSPPLEVQGEGTSRRGAEQVAASRALEQLGGDH